VADAAAAEPGAPESAPAPVAGRAARHGANGRAADRATVPATGMAATAPGLQPSVERAAPLGLAGRVRSLETFRALGNNPNFRLYWCGALTSNVGTWMQMVAQGWLVYQLTSSAFMLGAVGFAQSLPILLFSLFGGVLADRFERRRLMVWTQTGMMVLAFALAFLTLRGVITIWHILAIAFLNGTVNAFNTPVRQSIVSDLVRREDLQNAIAINSTQFQLSRSLGPALAGATLALVGPGWCFFINAMSFVAVIWTLLAMDVPPLPARRRSSTFSSIKESFLYVRSEPTVFALLLIAAIPSLFGQPYQQMLPALSEGVLRAGPTGLGVLQSAAGLGAVAGSLTIASLARSRRSGMTLIGAVILLGFALEVFGLSRVFWASSAVLFVVGFAQMSYNALNQTFLQQQLPDEMRGRVLALLTLTTFGLQPFGAMQAGTISAFLGPSMAMVVGGRVCVLCALVILARWPALRTLR
jgi:MFS family permease